MLCGLTQEDDWLPDRFYSESLQIKGTKVICRREEFQQMHHEYYDSLGWDRNGKPTEKTLNELELFEASDAIKSKDKRS
jgi:aldehyde:ferredoxin oxidoreductase